MGLWSDERSGEKSTCAATFSKSPPNRPVIIIARIIIVITIAITIDVVIAFIILLIIAIIVSVKPGSEASVTREAENAGGGDDLEGWGKFVEVCGAKKGLVKKRLRSNFSKSPRHHHCHHHCYHHRHHHRYHRCNDHRYTDHLHPRLHYRHHPGHHVQRWSFLGAGTFAKRKGCPID